jgi:hypothetical protein
MLLLHNLGFPSRPLAYEEDPEIALLFVSWLAQDLQHRMDEHLKQALSII